MHHPLYRLTGLNINIMTVFNCRYIHSERAEDDKVSVHRGIGGIKFNDRSEKSESVFESMKSLRLSQYFGKSDAAAIRRDSSDNQGLLKNPGDDEDLEMTIIDKTAKIIL